VAHRPPAQHYRPDRAAFGDFEPFWEFVSGPLNAGACPSGDLGATSGPERVFVKAPEAADVAPADGHQFFGEADIDGDAHEPTVRLREWDSAVLQQTGLEQTVLEPGKVGQ
jgi:alkaline phosphatase D